MGLKPFLTRAGRALSRLRRTLVGDRPRRPLLGVVSFLTPEAKLTRRDLRRLRDLGFVPTIAGASEDPPETGPNDPTADPSGDPAGDGRDPDPDPAGDGGRDPDTFPREYVERLRRESAGYRDRAQRAERLIEERADAERTELERATNRNRTLEQELADAHGQLWQLRAAVEHSIPADLVDLIGGASEEEAMERASKLAGRLASGDGDDDRRTPSPPRRARRDPSAISPDEAKRLAREDPEEFNRRFDAGEIPASAMQ